MGKGDGGEGSVVSRRRATGDNNQASNHFDNLNGRHHHHCPPHRPIPRPTSQRPSAASISDGAAARLKWDKGSPTPWALPSPQFPPERCARYVPCAALILGKREPGTKKNPGAFIGRRQLPTSLSHVAPASVNCLAEYLFLPSGSVPFPNGKPSSPPLMNLFGSLRVGRRSVHDGYMCSVDEL